MFAALFSTQSLFTQSHLIPISMILQVGSLGVIETGIDALLSTSLLKQQRHLAIAKNTGRQSAAAVSSLAMSLR